MVIVENKKIARDIFELVLARDDQGETEYIPGQFVDIKLPGFYLRRPFSVADFDTDTITLVYRIVGDGTEAMSKMQAGDSLDVLGPLGIGFEFGEGTVCPDCTAKPEDLKTSVLFGGGIGIPPIYCLAKAMVEAGEEPTVVLGFNDSEEIFWQDRFEALGLGERLIFTTVDGSYGIKGNVTDAVEHASYSYSCGPMPMLQAVHDISISGQYSFEARMGCGFGACMGCSIDTIFGSRRVCKDGPVFRHCEVLGGVLGGSDG